MQLFELIAQAIYGLSEVPPHENGDKKMYFLRALLVAAHPRPIPILFPVLGTIEVKRNKRLRSKQ